MLKVVVNSLSKKRIAAVVDLVQYVTHSSRAQNTLFHWPYALAINSQLIDRSDYCTDMEKMAFQVYD